MLGVILSALGAITPGLINLAVANRTIRKGARPGVMVALGASIIQLVYAFIAVYFIDIIIKNAAITTTINWVGVVVFLSLGLLYLLKKPKPMVRVESSGDSRHFGYGLGVAAMNMLIIPTWIVIALWLKGWGYDMHSLTEIFLLSLGSALGALAVFILYVKMADYIFNRMSSVVKYTNRFLGIVFLSLAIFQLARILWR